MVRRRRKRLTMEERAAVIELRAARRAGRAAASRSIHLKTREALRAAVRRAPRRPRRLPPAPTFAVEVYDRRAAAPVGRFEVYASPSRPRYAVRAALHEVLGVRRLPIGTKISRHRPSGVYMYEAYSAKVSRLD